MQKCIKCNSVDGVKKSGKLRGHQRYFCKECNYSFVPEPSKAKSKIKSKQITLSDLATYLDLSVSTVSKALNNKSDINQKTKDIVLKAAKDFNYEPNFLAQSLNQGVSYILGVIVPDIKHHYFAKILSGIHNVINDTKYSIIVCHSNESSDLENLHIDKLISYRVDGILISHVKEVNSSSHLAKIKDHRIPFVQFDRIFESYPSPKVKNNDIEGSYQTVNCLIKNGFKKIAVILGVKGLDISERRYQGFQKATKENNITTPEEYIVFSNLNKEGLETCFDFLLNLKNPPDAIFTAFIKDGVELVNLAKKRNVKIPSQLGLASFGDDEIASLIEPSLTTFNPNPIIIGEKAVSILLENIKSANFHSNTDIVEEGILIERDSSRRILL